MKTLLVAAFALATPATLAQHYVAGTRPVPLTAVPARYVVHMAQGEDRDAVGAALGAEGFTLAETLPDERGFYVAAAPAGLAAPAAEAALRRVGGVLRAHPDYVVGVEATGTAPFTIVDEVWFRPRADATPEALATLHARYGGTVVAVEHEALPGQRPAHTLRLRPGSPHATLDVANAYAASGLMVWAVPAAYISIQPAGTSTLPLAAPSRLLPEIQDSLYAQQWHLEHRGQVAGVVDTDLDAEGAWELVRGSADVVVGLFDTGVEGHEDFEAGQLLPNGYTVGDGGGDGTPNPGNRPDNSDYAHGQAVAGIIAAAFNGRGVRGVSDRTRILSVNIFPCIDPFLCRIQIPEFAAAIDTARVRGADIIHLSVAGSPGDSTLNPGTTDAIARARLLGRDGRGILVTAAGGNTGVLAFPADVPGVLSVGGVNAYGQPFCGTPVDRVDLVAFTGNPPCEGGTPPFPAITTMDREDRPGVLGYGPGSYTSTFSQTSAASPQAPGVAALLLAANPNLTEASSAKPSSTRPSRSGRIRGSGRGG